MRERVTFFHPTDTGVLPENLKRDKGGLEAPVFETTREDRLTLGLDELPAEVASVLNGFSSLHVAWNSPVAYRTLEPFAARLSPGLHVLFDPAVAGTSDKSDLCSLLRVFSPRDCSVDEAISTTITGLEGSPQPKQFFQPLEELSHFAKWLSSEACGAEDDACQSRAQRLLSAAGVDITYDAASKTAKVSAFWPLKKQPVSAPFSPHRRTEVGILTLGNPPNLAPDHVGVSGILTTLGEKKQPSPALFAFPARHKLSGSSFSTAFLTPTGLHPTLQLSLSGNQPPKEDAECKPYAYLTLPKTIFADRFQLDGELFMASKNLTALRATSLPVDLEAPAYTTGAWGSSILLELAPPTSAANQAWTAEVPLHLRYLKPSETGLESIEVPYPAVFWACSAEQGPEFSQNPFDRARVGYDTLFESDTVFWHVEPRPEHGDRLVNTISVPVLNEQGSALIGVGTSLVVALGFGWVLWKLYSAVAQNGYQATSEAAEEKKKR